MSSSRPIGGRWFFIVAPLLVYGCFVAGDDGGDGNEDGDSSGCRDNDDCRQGRVCLDIDGNRNDLCEEGEECACGRAGSGGGGSSTGGTAGDATGGTNEGGADDGGGDTGGNATGGSATGGNATGGNATGGNATGGNTTGGNTTGGNAGNATGGAGRGGTNTGGASGACGAYCARVLGAMCTAPSEAACLAECNALNADCPTQAPDVLACVADVSNPISCLSGSPVINGCDPELEARDRCLICLPVTGDGTCTTCSKGSCCTENGDYGLATDGVAFYECASACTTQACFDGCVASYPIAGNALTALYECENEACSEECICEVVADDDVCERCYKPSCCAETVAYILAPDVADFELCADQCLDQFCVDDCADAFPEAGAAIRSWNDCVDQECFDECAI